jgi:hypothetical protein
VQDLLENDIIHLLACAVRRQRQHGITTGKTEAGDGTPLQLFLAKVIEYRMSAPIIRLALKQHLSDAQDVTYLLDILAQWLQQMYNNEVRTEGSNVKLPSVSAVSFSVWIIIRL